MAQPRQIGDVLAQLIARRGYAREQAAAATQAAWQAVAGAQWASVTRAGSVRRGTLEITVSNNLLAQELGFRKDEFIAQLQQQLRGTKITNLRFRVDHVV
ncbi:MAG TPA: DciA family protein [Pirellulales bacterium]|jgi:predicted nucleic acid-binding Zn ribbon protein|nr:DciA family protein [Pirellulales bacterium]